MLLIEDGLVSARTGLSEQNAPLAVILLALEAISTSASARRTAPPSERRRSLRREQP